MTYRQIIQELKESEAPAVQAFARDVEGVRWMTQRERNRCLKNRQKPEAVRRLVEGFIPYIVMVAYYYCERARTLTMLDLISEGTLGAYEAFEKNRQGQPLTRRRVYVLIKRKMMHAMALDEQQSFAELTFDEELHDDEEWSDEELTCDMDRCCLRGVLRDMMARSLGERSAGIIYEYYIGQNKDLADIGKKYGVGSERIKQILRKVRKVNVQI